jgi:hypothetical protein
MAMSGSPFDTPPSFGYGAIEFAKSPAGFHATETVIHRLLERFWSENHRYSCIGMQPVVTQ